MNILETHGKNEKPWQRKRSYKEEPNVNLELKNTVTEIKISTDGLSSKKGKTQERINELEDTTVEIIQSEQHRENRLGEKNEQNLGDMLNYNKRSNTCVV